MGGPDAGTGTELRDWMRQVKSGRRASSASSGRMPSGDPGYGIAPPELLLALFAVGRGQWAAHTGW